MTKGLIWALVLAGILISAEMLLRVFAPQFGSLYFSDDVTGGHRVVYNSQGTRDPERPLPKAKGVRRVIVLGDSVTWGYGVGNDAIYLRRIERLWNQHHRRRLELWNLGGMGYSPRSYTDHLAALLSYRPDAVIIQINLNDVGDAWREMHGERSPAEWMTPGSPEARKLKAKTRPTFFKVLTTPGLWGQYAWLWVTRTHLGAWLIVQAMRLSYRLGIRKKDPRGRNRHEFMAFMDDEPATRAWIAYALDLIRLTRDFRCHGVRVMWVVFPYRYQVEGPGNLWGVNPRGFPVDPQARITFLADLLGVPVLDLRFAFVQARKRMLAGREQYQRLYLLLDANHPNRFGHALAGRAIYDFIDRRRWLTIDR